MGKKTLPTEDVPNGLNASVLAESIGFEDGDQILSVDGSPLEFVLDINKHLFLRSPKSVSVLHANGVKETLLIPEDFGSQMFEKGDLLPLSPIARIYVDSLYPGNPAEAAGMKVGDALLSFDGKPIRSPDDLRSDDLKGQDSVVFFYFKRE